MFKDQVVWITGASSGLGKHLAFEFAKYGAKLALSARSVEKLEEVLVAVQKLGGEGFIVPCDVLQEDQIRSVIVMVKAIFNRKKGYVFTVHGKIISYIGKHFTGLSRLMMRKLGG